jgi:hypothetical protein
MWRQGDEEWMRGEGLDQVFDQEMTLELVVSQDQGIEP